MATRNKKTKTRAVSGSVSKSIKGIPDDLKLGTVRQWVEKRVSERRFEHIKGVVNAGELLAFHADVNPYPVVLACWLHDSCKEIKAEKLVAMAKKYKMKISAIDQKYGHILHGPVAARLVKEKFSIKNRDVLSGIAEHTLGGINMSTISKLVYLADALEESRPESLKMAILEALTGGVDISSTEARVPLDLDRAILKASELTLFDLLDKGKVMHPKTVAVRNHFLELTRKAQNTRSKA